MKIKLMIFALLSLSVYCEAQEEYSCTFNLARDKESLNSTEIKKYLSNFSYNPQKEVAKSIELSGHKLIIWQKEAHLNLKVVGGDFKKPLTIQFSSTQKKVRFLYGQKLEFHCLKGSKTAESSAVELTDEKHLEKFGKNVVIHVKRPIVFSYLQKEESQQMRSVFFQDRKTFIESRRLNRKKPWCLLRVQIKEKKDTVMKMGEKLLPLSFDKQDNSDYFSTYSYSFVDFGTGKLNQQTKLYNPFMFTCNVLRGMSFKVETLRAIVGKNLYLESTL